MLTVLLAWVGPLGSGVVQPHLLPGTSPTQGCSTPSQPWKGQCYPAAHVLSPNRPLGLVTGPNLRPRLAVCLPEELVCDRSRMLGGFPRHCTSLFVALVLTSEYESIPGVGLMSPTFLQALFWHCLSAETWGGSRKLRMGSASRLCWACRLRQSELCSRRTAWGQ